MCAAKTPAKAAIPDQPGPPSPAKVSVCAIFGRVVLGIVQADSPDLTMRQLAVLNNPNTASRAATVRSLALLLNVNKPAITRACDRLAQFGFIERRVDAMDRRSVFIGRTPKGEAFLKRFLSDKHAA